MANSKLKRWIAALESGDYSQTKSVLRDEQGFCCLGVACDLYAKDHPVMAGWDRDDFYLEDGNFTALPPTAIIEDMGLDPIGCTNNGAQVQIQSELASNWNDMFGESFMEIAGRLREENGLMGVDLTDYYAPTTS